MDFLKRPDIAQVLGRYQGFLEKEFTEEPQRLEEATRRFAEAESVPLADLAQPVGAVLTGWRATPPLFAVAAILGKEASLRRLSRAGDLVARAQAAPAR